MSFVAPGSSYAAQFNRNWSKRAAYLKAQGIPFEKYRQVAEYDRQRVMQGQAPLDRSEASVMISNQLSGPVIQNPRPQTTLQQIPGNIVKDIKEQVVGLHPINLVKAIGKDLSRIDEAPKGLAKVVGKLAQGKVSEGLKEIRHVPGITSAALLGSFTGGPAAYKLAAGTFAAPVAGQVLQGPEGWQEIAEHPLNTALDVWPVAKPLQTLNRLEKLESIGPAVQRARQAKADFLQRKGLDPWSRQVWTRHSQLEREARIFVGEQLHKNTEGMNLTAAQAEEFWKLTQRHKAGQQIPEEFQDAFAYYLTKKDDLLRRGLESGDYMLLPMDAEGQLGDLRDWNPRDPKNIALPHRIISANDKTLVGRYRAYERRQGRRQGVETAYREARAELDELSGRVVSSQSKIRAVGEDAESFAKRPPDLFSNPEPHKVLAGAFGPLVQRFINPRANIPELADAPNNVIRLADSVREQSSRAFALMEQGRVGSSRHALRSAMATLDRPPVRESSWAAVAKEEISRFMDESKDWDNRIRSHEKLLGQHRSQAAKTSILQNRIANQIKLQESAFRGLTRAHMSRPDPAFHYMIGERIGQAAAGEAEALGRLEAFKHLDPDARAVEMTRIHDELGAGFYAPLLGEQRFKDIVSDAMGTWTGMWRQGHRPVWVHHVSERQARQLFYPKVLDRVKTPSHLRKRVFDGEPGFQNVALALTHAEMENYLHDASLRFVTEDLAGKLGAVKTYEDWYRHLEETRPNWTPEQRKLYLDRNYTSFNEEAVAKFLNVGTSKLPKKLQSEKLMMPRQIAEGLGHLAGQMDEFQRFSNKALRLHYTSVMFASPRHFAHVMFSSLMMMLGREGLAPLRHLKEAREMVRNERLPVEMARAIGHVDPYTLRHAWGMGKTQARLLEDYLGTKASAPWEKAKELNNWLKEQEEFVSDMHRAMVYLSKKGDHAAGIEAVGKTFMNWDRRSPLERRIIRSWLPWGGWTSHVLSYLFNLSVDHPVRVAALSHLAQNEMEDWNSGLGLRWMQLFPVGRKDEEGNQPFIDLRSMNPFRDVGNYLTMGGFMSSLNPVFGGMLQTLGVRVPSGTPEAYPDLVYNAETGQLEAKRSNTVSAFAGAYVPQTRGISEYVGLTNELMHLRETDPSKYNQVIASQFGMPWLPISASKQQEAAKTELRRFRSAQAALTKGMKEGKWDEALRYNLVPFRGRMVDPQKLKALWEKANAANTSVYATRAVLPNR